MSAMKPVTMARSSIPDIMQSLVERTLLYDFTVWFWGDAIAVDGLLAAAAILGRDDVEERLRGYYLRWSKRPLGWVDHLTPGAALLNLATTESGGLLDAAVRLADFLLSAPRSREGAPLYRPDLPPYRHTVWVDTIYHEPSFFARLANRSGETRFMDAALESWSAHVRVLCSPDLPFLGHAFDSGAQRLKGYGWGRGNGWALLGEVDALEAIPDDHPRRTWAVENFQRLSEDILRLQDSSGFWRTLLHDRESYLESSTAPFFGAAFSKGVRLGLLRMEYQAAADLAWKAMSSRLSNGELYGVSACTYATTSADDDIAMYKTLPTEVNVWGQGAALRFAVERYLLEAGQ
jgi:unsaturated rhamnogalacturonyl hydrolase